MSKHHGHKKHHGQKTLKDNEPQVKSPVAEQRKKAEEHEPQAARNANSNTAVSPNAPGIPKTDPNPPKEAKDDEKQQLSEGGSQGEVPEDHDQKMFRAMKEIAPALKKFKEAIESEAHLDEDMKRLLDAGNKILGKMDSDHVGDASAIPQAPEFTGDLDKKAEEEGKAGTKDQPLIKDQSKDINNTESNDGKVDKDGKVSDQPFGPGDSKPVADLTDTEKADLEKPKGDEPPTAFPQNDHPAGEV